MAAAPYSHRFYRDGRRRRPSRPWQRPAGRRRRRRRTGGPSGRGRAGPRRAGWVCLPDPDVPPEAIASAAPRAGGHRLTITIASESGHRLTIAIASGHRLRAPEAIAAPYPQAENLPFHRKSCIKASRVWPALPPAVQDSMYFFPSGTEICRINFPRLAADWRGECYSVRQVGDDRCVG
jgi:hypothetical protein